MYEQARRNEIITKLDAETSRKCTFADTWKDLFFSLILNQAELHQQVGARRESGGKELESLLPEMFFMREVSIDFVQHSGTDSIFDLEKNKRNFSVFSLALSKRR